MERMLISEVLGANGNRIAQLLNATHCTRVGSTEDHTAYILHGQAYDFRWIEDNGDGVGEDEDGFDAPSRRSLAQGGLVNEANDWLTLTEAGARWGQKPDTLRKKLNRGRLIGQRRGRDWFISTATMTAAYGPEPDAEG